MRKVFMSLLTVVALLGLVGCGRNDDALMAELEALRTEIEDLRVQEELVYTEYEDDNDEYIAEGYEEIEEAIEEDEAFDQDAIRASLVPSGRTPENDFVSNSFIGGDDVIFYYAPNIIYTTLGSENGLMDTPMFTRGKIASLEYDAGLSADTGVTNYRMMLSTDYGELMLAVSSGIWELGVTLGAIPAVNELDLLDVGSERDVLFLYTGFSMALDVPAGIFIGLYDFEEEEVAVETVMTPEPIANSLVGTWLFMGSPYYVFNEGGRGTMTGMAIRWSTNNGVLSICGTPDICATRCLAPMEWRYTISGDSLTLTSTTIQGMTFTYTRQ